ncbi:MAG: hypothetical protein ACREX8_17540, partial [Gammaproteobacteria bacterium]
ISVMREPIDDGYMAFLSGGREGFGAVRQICPGGDPSLVIYVENAGDFTVPLSAIEAIQPQKIILDGDRLDPCLREAIRHAHDAEDLGI